MLGWEVGGFAIAVPITGITVTVTVAVAPSLAGQRGRAARSVVGGPFGAGQRDAGEPYRQAASVDEQQRRFVADAAQIDARNTRRIRRSVLRAA